MILNNLFRINGQFKIDTYGKDNQLKETTNYFDNFITSTGLEYIKTFAFADCFRYLSLGSGTTLNSLTTTGISTGIPQFSYIGGTQNDGCTEQLASQYDGKSCGYKISNSGVILSRGWRVPTGSDFFDTDYEFQEFVLSPGQPYATGYESDGITYTPAQVCGCDQPITYISPGVDGPVYGKESSDFVSNYPTICDSVSAFVRVLKDTPKLKGDYLVVNYSLNVNFNTGMRNFNILVNRSPLPSQTNPIDPYNWVVSSGVYSIIHPGIKLINDGNVTNVTPDFNTPIGITVGGNPRLGESFIPPLGWVASYNMAHSLPFHINNE